MEWISVNERLPEMIKGKPFSERVLIHAVHTYWPSKSFIVAHYHKYGSWIGDSLGVDQEVTHWMTIPKPPTE